MALDGGFKAPSAVRWSQEPGRGPAAYPTAGKGSSKAPGGSPNSSWVRGPPSHPQRSEPQGIPTQLPSPGTPLCTPPPKFHLGIQGGFQEKEVPSGGYPGVFSAKSLQRTKAWSPQSLSVLGSGPPDTLRCTWPLTIVGPSTEILLAAVDAPLAAAGLVAALGGAGLRSVADTAPQEQVQLVTQCATVPAEIHGLPVTFVHAQGGCGVGARPACAQALHGTQVEEPVPGDPLPALGSKAATAVWRDPDLPTLGLQAALQSIAEDEEDAGF